jgi:hypothetical protein
MTIQVLEFPQNDVAKMLLELAKGATERAGKVPEKWWPKRMNNYPVTNLSPVLCCLELEKTNKHHTEFFYWNDEGNDVWSIVTEIYETSSMTTSDFVLCLPH